MSRIIAGRRRGQRLAAPSGSATRPTTDRVREAAFNLIADWAGTAGEPADRMLARFSFLDLYAGSGAVGLEAASRGAAPVVCVEKDPRTASLARRNAATLDLDVAVVTAGADAYLGRPPPAAFDVVWLDPPYAHPAAAVGDVVRRVMAGGWLAADGLVVVERSARGEAPPWPAGVRVRARRYGETVLFLATAADDRTPKEEE